MVSKKGLKYWAHMLMNIFCNAKYFLQLHPFDSAPIIVTSAGILTYVRSAIVYIPWIVNHFSIFYLVISVVHVFDRNQTEKNLHLIDSAPTNRLH